MKDQLGYTVNLNKVPKRIISLVPSQTELLFDLGLGDSIVGVTKFCVHPADKVKDKTIIGGTKKFRFDVIESLKPDLIIGNKEENYKEGIKKLTNDYPVWVSDIYTIEDALDMIDSLSRLTDKEAEGRSLIEKISANFQLLKKVRAKTALYFIWNNPFMVAGKHTFINHILERTGLTNATDESRYPEISREEIQALDPNVILLSSEPFPFKDKHIDDFKSLCPNADIRIVDGEMFSWYGSRLAKAPHYINSLGL